MQAPIGGATQRQCSWLSLQPAAQYNSWDMCQPGEVTRLLRGLEPNDSSRMQRLIELLYVELRRIARSRISAERPGHTLTPTALVHEAYLKLAGDAERTYADRRHFFAVAAQAMRRILVDHARARQAARRGGIDVPLSLDELNIASPLPDNQLLALDLALAELAKRSDRQSRVVELKYFAGLTEDEIAEVLGVTRRTVCRDWQLARAWLLAAVSGVERK